MSGYDKFFKEAGKASGLMTGRPAPKVKASTKSQFKISKDSPSEKRTGTAEDRLRQEVALRARNRKAIAARKRKAFPVFPAIIAVIAIVSCTIGFVRPELADQVLSHIEIGAFGKANAAETADAKKAEAAKLAKESKSLASKQAAAAVNAVTAVNAGAAGDAKIVSGLEAAKAGVTPDIRNWTPDELSFFNKLDDRKKELDVRESELAKLEEELQKQKAELDEKIKQLEGMRADISKTLKTRVAVDQEKVDKLVQFYSTMKPQQAAKVIESLNEDLAVEVIDKMKKKSAAEIMNALDPKKARRLSELMTGYQRGPAADAEDRAEN